MRIGFLGKGGSGKTTMAAGFIKYMSERHPFVLAVDADCNAHLGSALNFSEEPQLLGGLYDEIVDYFKGDRTDLGDRPFVCTTPPSLKSKFVTVSPDDPFIARYGLRKDNISLLTVGPYEKSDVGSSCYHTKLTGVTAVFHHLLDRDTDAVVSDTTAGTDNVATSLSFVYDINVFVVEPTLKSVNVYLDFINIVPYLADRIFIVANKISEQQDVTFLEKHLPKDKILGAIPFSHDLKHFEQGDLNAGFTFYSKQGKTFSRIYDVLRNQKRDWDQYLQYLRQAHEKVCKDWWNGYYKTELTENLDEAFTYQAVSEEKFAVTDTARDLISSYS